jgi:hypothetical protein
MATIPTKVIADMIMAIPIVGFIITWSMNLHKAFTTKFSTCRIALTVLQQDNNQPMLYQQPPRANLLSSHNDDKQTRY